MNQRIFLIDDHSEKARPVFPDRTSYENFRKGYRERVVPELENYRKAHQASQQRAWERKEF